MAITLRAALNNLYIKITLLLFDLQPVSVIEPHESYSTAVQDFLIVCVELNISFYSLDELL